MTLWSSRTLLSSVSFRDNQIEIQLEDSGQHLSSISIESRLILPKVSKEHHVAAMFFAFFVIAVAYMIDLFILLLFILYIIHLCYILFIFYLCMFDLLVKSSY